MRNSGHLLVVDDDSAALRLMMATLERAGHRVRPANGGELALAAIAHERPELVLLDLHMSRLGGLAVCARMKADPMMRDIPIIVISGTNNLGDRLAVLRHGAVDFILKPFNAEELLARVENHLELERLRARLTQQTEALQQAAREFESEVAERRQAQEALQEKASRLALATQAGQVGIWDWDIPRDRLHWDDTLRDIFGLPDDGATASYAVWESLLHPEDRDRCREETAKVIADGNEYSTEHRIVRPDGDVRHLRGRALIQRDSAGRAVRMLGTNLDITEQIRNQERLLLFSRTVEQSSESVVIANARGDVEYVNETFLKLSGYAPTEIIGSNLRTVVAREMSSEAFNELWETITRGDIWTAEFQNSTKTGQLYWASATIMPIKSDDGRITHFVATKEEITARRTAEAALRHEQWLIKCLMDTAPALIFFKDTAGRFIRVNQAQAALFGLQSPDQILGRTHHDFYGVTEAAAATKDEQTIMQTGRPSLDKMEKLTLGDGTVRWFSTNRMPLRDTTGHITGTFGLSTDVTAQRQGEAERIHLQMQLTQAQKLESIGRLAAGIAHEINTPTQFVNDNISYVGKAMGEIERLLVAHADLIKWVESQGMLAPEVTSILEPVSRIKQGTLRREVPAALADALDGMARITKIVRAMKNFSHPGGKGMEPTDLNQTIESTLVVCRSEWKYVAALETHYAPDLPLVPCMRGDFSQVILNLVVNAAHAIAAVPKHDSTHPGQITVTTLVSDDWAEVRISDTGTGIPESAQPHIFEPFFTTKEVGKGTGQGLAIARSVVVDRHKGTLTFTTEKGRGTTFIIRLPLR
jgi:PAS domain S-box-containing protein